MSTMHSIAQLDSAQVKFSEIWLDHQALHKVKNIRLRPLGSMVREDRRIISGLIVKENLQLAQITEPIG